MARILLADDDMAIRDLVRRALEADGHSVEATEDGAEALERLARGRDRFELIVTDVQMPALDGISLAEQALKLDPGLRILLMSGYADALERASSFKAAKLGTILKPFTLDQIRALVRTTLS
ncbi:MAG: response regulator [Planctomycetaceae bacterium]|nr:response regulator [Planctomycetaceae bacterium]PPD29477.1 MAG: response regulator [Hyphomicrobium sp.]